MVKKLFLLILFLCLSNPSFAVTTFDVTVKSAGGDWTTLSSAEAALDVDITSSTEARVFSFDASSGTIPDVTSCSTDGGATTGTCIHKSVGNQILIVGITGGTFDNDDVVTDGTNTVTLSDSGDEARIVLTIYTDLTYTQFTWDGGTYDSTNTLTIQGDTTNWNGTTSGGVKITANGWGGFRALDPYITIKNLIIECSSDTCFFSGGGTGSTYGINLIFLYGGIKNANGIYNSQQYFFNCSSIDSTRDCINTGYNTSGITAYNFTCISPAEYGFRATWKNINLYNSVAFDYVSGFALKGNGSVSGDYWACSGTSCNTVSNYVTDLTMSNELVNGLDGNPHLLSSSSLINAGNDYSGTTGISYDIDNVTRSGTWDIGADEYVAATASRNRMILLQ